MNARQLLRTPQDILGQLRAVLPHGEPRRDEPSSAERILDAALAAFSADGVRAVSMSRVAKDAGVSREWLYRKFKNRDGVIIAVTQREVTRFIDELALRVPVDGDLDDVMVDTFVFAVEFLRDHELLQRVLRDEPDVINGQLLERGGNVGTVAAQAASSYLVALAGLDPDAATTVADTLVRLVATIVFVPHGVRDLHDHHTLHDYARVMVPAVIAATRHSVPTKGTP